MNKPVRIKRGTRDFAQKAKDVTLARWDQGANGQANRIGLVKEDRGHRDTATGKIINPNNVKGVRRVDMLETYYQRGVISKRGYTAAEELRDAWGNTQRSKGVDLSDVRVDQTSKPDDDIDIKIDRMSRLVRLSKHIAKEDVAIVSTVVYDGRCVSDMREYRHIHKDKGLQHLRRALDRIADKMGY